MKNDTEKQRASEAMQNMFFIKVILLSSPPGIKAMGCLGRVESSRSLREVKGVRVTNWIKNPGLIRVMYY